MDIENIARELAEHAKDPISILGAIRQGMELAFAAGVAQERERAAKVCEKVETIYVDDSNRNTAAPLIRECAANIRNGDTP